MRMDFDVKSIRQDFPILKKKLRGGKDLIYFDNGASAQKPSCAIEAISSFYKENYSNIHRSSHQLSNSATSLYENARECIAEFFNAGSAYECIYTKGTTEALNMVASSYVQNYLNAGDEIILTGMEHHANIVCWYIVANKIGAKLLVVGLNEDGSLDMNDLKSKISSKTKFLSVCGASNVLGTVNDVKEISKICKANDIKFCLDSAQSAPHFLLDVDEIQADFYAVSAHKCFGPTGMGLLIARAELLEQMQVYQSGGDMIEKVSWEKITYKKAPAKFEAGTQNIAGAIGFAQAIKYLKTLNLEALKLHENSLLEKLTSRLDAIEGVKIFGRAKGKLPIVSFICENVHTNDVSVMLDNYGIAIRTGRHCADPLMDKLGVDSTCRASLAFYNTLEEVDYFADKLEYVLKLLR